LEYINFYKVGIGGIIMPNLIDVALTKKQVKRLQKICEEIYSSEHMINDGKGFTVDVKHEYGEPIFIDERGFRVVDSTAIDDAIGIAKKYEEKYGGEINILNYCRK